MSLKNKEINKFFKLAKNIGLKNFEDLERFLKEESKDNESEIETMERYYKEIGGDDFHLLDESTLNEVVVQKPNGKWVNRSKSGKEFGEFDTKKQALAQMRAMYANESLEESSNECMIDKAKKFFAKKKEVPVDESMDRLADELNNVIVKYDEDAYFDHEYPGIINAYIFKDVEDLSEEFDDSFTWDIEMKHCDFSENDDVKDKEYFINK